MPFRSRLATALATGGRVRVMSWAVAPLLCVMLPGLGALLAFVWIAALLGLGRQPLGFIGVRPMTARSVVVAFWLATAVLLLSQFVLEPLARWVANQPPDLSALGDLQGHAARLATLLLVSWIVGAVVEETVFRGFLIGYGVRVFGPRRRWVLALLSAAAFGFSHLYQGAAGVLLTGLVGLLLAAIYLATGRSLPTVMLVHGLVDTASIVELYLGLQSTA